MVPLLETARLKAYVVGLDAAKQLLAYESRNRAAFAPFSVTHQTSFYTLSSLQDVCEKQVSLYLKGRMLPLLFFAKEDPLHILGTVNLNHIVWGASRSAKLGYSIDVNHQGQGYGKEAVQAAVSYAFKTLHLHRLEAHVMRANAPSIALVNSLGFCCEGVCSGYLYVNGRWEDHLRYALLGDDRRP